MTIAKMDGNELPSYRRAIYRVDRNATGIPSKEIMKKLFVL